MGMYTFKCSYPTCGHKFERLLNAWLYAQYRDDGFMQVACEMCGTNKPVRDFGPGSMPTNITPKGTFPRSASPEIAGKSYYGREERDALLAAADSVSADGKDSGHVEPPKGTKYKVKGGTTVKVVTARTKLERLVVQYLAAQDEPRGAPEIHDWVSKRHSCKRPAVAKVLQRLRTTDKQVGPVSRVGFGRYAIDRSATAA